MWRRRGRALVALTKPGITLANTLMAALGLAAGQPRGARDAALLLVGTAALVASSAVANMLIERERDALMQRTAGRPLPTGQVSAPVAAAWCASLGLSGAAAVGAVSGAALAAGLLGWALYALIYTPLKPRSAWSLPVGALAGAMPPVMGALAAGAPGAALALGLMVGAWQLPHVIALTLRYRDEYRAASLRLAALPTAALVALARGGAALCCLSAALAATWLGASGWGLPAAALPALIAALRAPEPRSGWAASVLGHGFWLFVAAPLVALGAAWTAP